MKKIVSSIVLAMGLAVLSGCDRYCEDCDSNRAPRKIEGTAVTGCTDCVPAPAPLNADGTPSAQVATAAETKPVCERCIAPRREVFTPREEYVHIRTGEK